MVFQQFYRYGVLFLSLGLIEVATITPHEVIAITNGDFFGGPGCFVYYPHDDEFEFIPKIYHHYEEIKGALLQAGDDENLLQEEGNNRDMLEHAYHLIAQSLNILQRFLKHECQEYYKKSKILSYASSDEDRSLRLQYNNFTGEVKEVEIIFLENAGLEAILEILSDSGTDSSEELILV